MPAQAFSDPDAVRLEAEAWGRAHVAGGGRLVGFVTASAPVEMVEAAGMAAMELSAGDVSDTPRADEIMEDLFHPPIRGLLERILRGDFAHLSAIVLPRTSDAPHRLYYYLCELQRSGVAVPKPLLFDITQTPGEASEAYAAQALAHLWDQLRAISGQGDDASLRAAIGDGQQRQGLLSRLVERRRTSTVPGAAALATFMASRMLPLERFEAGLRAMLAAAPIAITGPRLLIAGSTHDDAGLHGLIEAAGGAVVGDVHGAGELAIADPIILGADPLEGLLHSYRATRAGARAFRDSADDILEMARATEADGVFFSYLPEEEALTWDYPAQAQLLDRSGIAQTRLDPQARPYDIAARRAEVNAFIRSLGDAR